MSCSSRGYRPSWCAVPRGRPAEQGPAGDPFIGEDAGVLVSKAGTRAVDRVVRGDGVEQAGLAPDVAIGGGPEHEIALRRRRHCQDRGRARRLRRPRASVCAPEGPAPRGGVRCLTWQWPTRNADPPNALGMTLMHDPRSMHPTEPAHRIGPSWPRSHRGVGSSREVPARGRHGGRRARHHPAVAALRADQVAAEGSDRLGYLVRTKRRVQPGRDRADRLPITCLIAPERNPQIR